MTKNDAIAYFKRHIELYCVDGISRESEEMAIKALEQEPCEDAVSREEAFEGKWIPIPFVLDYESDAKCSLCQESLIDAIEYNYCPNCGAKMEGEVEDADSN